MAVAQPTAGRAARPSRTQKLWNNISIVFESRIATVGMLLVLFWVVLGLISLVWTPYPPNANLFEQNLSPNSVNWLGTDNLGRDLLSRLMVGTQVILLKTRVPEFGFGSYLIFLASLAGIISLIAFFMIWARMFSRFRPLFFGVLAVAAVVLLFYIFTLFFRPISFPVIGSLSNLLIGLLALIFLGIMVFAFVWGWFHARRFKLTRVMIVWTVSFILFLILTPASFPGQGITVPSYSLPIGVAIWGVIGSVIFGSLLGLNAGYRGAWADQGTMQVLDALIAFPVIVLYLVVIAALGQGDLVVILAITITGVPGVARLVRSLSLDIKTRDYIRAAETRGESAWYIMFVEILPNARGPLLVDSMLRVGYAIFAIGTLGFLGIGLPPPDPDWGSMVNEARKTIFINQWAVVWPSLAIASLVIGLNLFADGLREELTRYQK
jgi:ABC-type dipeptide/oligopeptide/nickel transport system permease subunit